jgi:epoxide hydrolase-like predicted phosphatase
MIKAIIFDFGGVLSKKGSFKPLCKKYAKKHNVSYNGFYDVLRDIWFKTRTNKVDSKLFWKECADYLNIDPVKLKKDMMKSDGYNKKTIRLIKKLKKEYKVGLLSNHIEDWLEEIIQKRKLDKLFDVIVTSYGSKLAKPDIKIFKEIVKKLKVKPQECIFIDDIKTNIPPAKKLGMKTILFKNLNQTKKELNKFGIKCTK